ncbi:MAG: hypothetical protein JXN65_09710 [Clostridia bacterium]|nr:hypothetical protein [Clostridia bacterium]
MKIDFNFINEILNSDDNKSISCTVDEYLLSQYENSSKNLFEFIKNEFNKYELAQYIKYISYYINSKNQVNCLKYPPRSIAYIEFGANSKTTLSYEHAAVIIRETGSRVFVVPCSSSLSAHKKLEKNPDEYMFGNTKNGFEKDTILFIQECKWVDKSMIKFQPTRKVDQLFFEDIYNKIFRNLFHKYHKILKELEDSEAEMKKELSSYINTIEELNNQLEREKKINLELTNLLDDETSPDIDSSN